MGSQPTCRCRNVCFTRCITLRCSYCLILSGGRTGDTHLCHFTCCALSQAGNYVVFPLKFKVAQLFSFYMVMKPFLSPCFLPFSMLCSSYCEPLTGLYRMSPSPWSWRWRGSTTLQSKHWLKTRRPCWWVEANGPPLALQAPPAHVRRNMGHTHTSWCVHIVLNCTHVNIKSDQQVRECSKWGRIWTLLVSKISIKNLQGLLYKCVHLKLT